MQELVETKKCGKPLLFFPSLNFETFSEGYTRGYSV